MDTKQIKIVKRKIKYSRIELKTGNPVLITPQNTKIDVEAIKNKHSQWLNKKIQLINKIKNKYKKEKIYHHQEKNLINFIQRYIDKYSKILKIKPKKINFRIMKTKWGSCSRKGKLSFNLLLKYLPQSLIKYVVYHEMTHLLIPNHKKNFWMLIKKQFKNPEKFEEKLYGYWFLLNDSLKLFKNEF